MRTVGTGQTFATISAAVTAAVPGDEILVFPGTYVESVLVTKSNLTFVSQTLGAAIVQFTSPGNVFNLDGATGGARCTRITGFSILLLQTGIGGITGKGIQVQNGATAIIDNNTITGVGVVNTAQTGNGINVDVGSAAMILSNTILHYQKTGIRINGAGTCAGVFNNTVTGVGPMLTLAQNGIQISRGASANVMGNVVTGNIFNNTTAAVSTGILLFSESSTSPLVVQFNTGTGNNVGIFLDSTTSALVQGNVASNNTVDGTVASDGSLTPSINNVFLRNVAHGNPLFDMEDDTVGLLSALTGNVYLCNDCSTDNRGGAICTSATPLMTSATTPVLLFFFTPGVHATLFASPE